MVNKVISSQSYQFTTDLWENNYFFCKMKDYVKRPGVENKKNVSRYFS